jgi:CheY-like chemotaxis protein
MYVVPNVYRPTILLVEDEGLIQMMACEALEERGWQVIAVSAGEDALGLALMDTHFDALFTDINLAGPLNGWELAETMRDMRPDLAVIYTSGAASVQDREQQVTDSAFFAKPYDIGAVAALLDRLLRGQPQLGRNQAWTAPAGESPLALSA